MTNFSSKEPLNEEKPDILTDLRTPEARAQLEADERRIHSVLIKRARQHEVILASSREQLLKGSDEDHSC